MTVRFYPPGLRVLYDKVKKQRETLQKVLAVLEAQDSDTDANAYNLAWEDALIADTEYQEQCRAFVDHLIQMERLS